MSSCMLHHERAALSRRGKSCGDNRSCSKKHGIYHNVSEGRHCCFIDDLVGLVTRACMLKANSGESFIVNAHGGTESKVQGMCVHWKYKAPGGLAIYTVPLVDTGGGCTQETLTSMLWHLPCRSFGTGFIGW